MNCGNIHIFRTVGRGVWLGGMVYVLIMIFGCNSMPLSEEKTITNGNSKVDKITLKKWSHDKGLVTVSTVHQPNDIAAVLQWIEDHIPASLDPHTIGCVMPECVLDIETRTTDGKSTIRSVDLYSIIDRTGAVAIEQQAFVRLFEIFKGHASVSE